MFKPLLQWPETSTAEGAMGSMALRGVLMGLFLAVLAVDSDASVVERDGSYNYRVEIAAYGTFRESRSEMSVD